MTDQNREIDVTGLHYAETLKSRPIEWKEDTDGRLFTVIFKGMKFFKDGFELYTIIDQGEVASVRMLYTPQMPYYGMAFELLVKDGKEYIYKLMWLEDQEIAISYQKLRRLKTENPRVFDKNWKVKSKAVRRRNIKKTKER